MERKSQQADTAVEDMRIAAARMRRSLKEMRELKGADGEPVFSGHMIRMAEDSVDAAERYAGAAKARQKA
jgi:type II secretory pathway component PulM